MRWLASLLLIATVVSSQPASIKPSQPQGIDVSDENVDFAKLAKNGMKFVYSKATEGGDFKNNFFQKHFTGARKAGLLHGAYHFARPDNKTAPGATQAKFFLANGGHWKNDGKTLPGVLDIEENPGKNGKCYGKSPTEMVAWIKDFSDTYKKATSRFPAIYTNPDWWEFCTKNSKAFSATHPLWLARFDSKTVGKLPGGWKTAAIWQYADKDSTGKNPGDQNVFLGDAAALKKYVTGGTDSAKPESTEDRNGETPKEPQDPKPSKDTKEPQDPKSPDDTSGPTFKGQVTFFTPDTGSCGNVNLPTDFIAAASHLLVNTFPGHTKNPNKNAICKQIAEVTHNGKKIRVRIQDTCGACKLHDLDLTPSAFKALGIPFDAGRADVTWKWVKPAGEST